MIDFNKKLEYKNIAKQLCFWFLFPEVRNKISEIRKKYFDKNLGTSRSSLTVFFAKMPEIAVKDISLITDKELRPLDNFMPVMKYVFDFDLENNILPKYKYYNLEFMLNYIEVLKSESDKKKT